jgi:hypothetical protein
MLKYQLNDAYVGLEYKFRIGKWTNKPGLYAHWYDLISQQNSGDEGYYHTTAMEQ